VSIRPAAPASIAVRASLPTQAHWHSECSFLLICAYPLLPNKASASSSYLHLPSTSSPDPSPRPRRPACLSVSSISRIQDVSPSHPRACPHASTVCQPNHPLVEEYSPRVNNVRQHPHHRTAWATRLVQARTSMLHDACTIIDAEHAHGLSESPMRAQASRH
jgi:hypothetical protein